MASIHYLSAIQFDFGAVATLRTETARLGMRIPFLVTDRGVISSGLFDRIRGFLPNLSTERIFDATPQNPTESAVEDATALYLRQDCDGVVALGGGSPIDLAKAVALRATHSGSLADFAAVAGGMERITAAVAPLIAVPTTAGPGSEVGRATVIVMKDGRKRAIVSPHLVPRVAICDPELTLTLPPQLTAGTGMDAISHCVETFLSPAMNPPADAIALDGLSRGVSNIERAVSQGSDRAARWQMMMASLEGGLAFQKGLGAVHAMSHPLGALPGLTVHHGTANAVLLPVVLRRNAASSHEKYARLRSALGCAAITDLGAYFDALLRRLGLPASLRELGVPHDQLPHLAMAAEQDYSSRTNPQSIDVAGYLELFEEAYG
jgi:4-hydroxybutyrate dehydrogenase